MSKASQAVALFVKRERSETLRRMQRHALGRGLDQIRKGNTLKLDSVQVRVLEGMIEAVLCGYDVRPALGITPARGAPPKFAGPYKVLAHHYYLLLEMGMAEKGLASILAADWGMSPAHIRKIARPLKRQCIAEIQLIPTKELGGENARRAHAEMRYLGAMVQHRPHPEIDSLWKEAKRLGATGLLFDGVDKLGI